MKLINHQTFERIPNRIDIIDPSEPGFHITCRDREPGVNDESEHENGRRRKCSCYRLGTRRDRPKDT